MRKGRTTITFTGVATAALLAGWAAGQDSGSVEERLKKVRREVKIIDLETAVPRVPALLERERAYAASLDEIAAAPPEKLPELFAKARDLKLAALKDLNEILRLHRGRHVGLSEAEIFERLQRRFVNVRYSDEWLVNILDDLETSCQINIELDARVYKFDTVSFDFETTSARAMLQIMADELLFNWVVRGDTLYVYKERNEVLFGKDWDDAKRKARKMRDDAAKRAIEEAKKKEEESR